MQWNVSLWWSKCIGALAVSYTCSKVISSLSSVVGTWNLLLIFSCNSATKKNETCNKLNIEVKYANFWHNQFMVTLAPSRSWSVSAHAMLLWILWHLLQHRIRFVYINTHVHGKSHSSSCLIFLFIAFCCKRFDFRESLWEGNN